MSYQMEWISSLGMVERKEEEKNARINKLNNILIAEKSMKN